MPSVGICAVLKRPVSPDLEALSTSILDLFVTVDTFWQTFAPWWEREQLASGQRRHKRATQLSPSEIMTILILFQQSGYRTFKGFYTQYFQTLLRAEFPLWQPAIRRRRTIHRAPRHFRTIHCDNCGLCDTALSFL